MEGGGLRDREVGPCRGDADRDRRAPREPVLPRAGAHRRQQAASASDLYAVGVLLYEALTGRKPFEGDDPFALAAAIRDGRYEPATAIDADADPRIVTVIERAMRRDPTERYESAGAMAAELLGDERDDDAPATEVIPGPIAPDVDTEPDGHETVPIPRMERTARLPSQPSTSPPGIPPAAPRGSV